MRALGLGFMIEEGRVRRTIHVALKDMGIHYPYPLKGNVDNTERSPFRSVWTTVYRNLSGLLVLILRQR